MFRRLQRFSCPPHRQQFSMATKEFLDAMDKRDDCSREKHVQFGRFYFDNGSLLKVLQYSFDIISPTQIRRLFASTYCGTALSKLTTLLKTRPNLSEHGCQHSGFLFDRLTNYVPSAKVFGNLKLQIYESVVLPNVPVYDEACIVRDGSVCRLDVTWGPTKYVYARAKADQKEAETPEDDVKKVVYHKVAGAVQTLCGGIGIIMECHQVKLMS